MTTADVPIKITDNIYLGNFNAANYESLKRYNISAVVCLTNDSHKYSDDIVLLHTDDISEDLDSRTFTLDKLEKAVDFIEQQIALDKNILVHCMAGASRSPTVIIAYIIKHKDLNVNQACDFVRAKASHINPAFIELLENYYYTLH